MEKGIIYDGIIKENVKPGIHYFHPGDPVKSPFYLIDDEKYIIIDDKACKGIVPNRYLVSDKGNVYDREKGCNCNIQNSTYNKVQLSVIGRKRKSISKEIHRIELSAHDYVEGCEFLEVNHIDLNKKNNDLKNLEWLTHEENMHHAIKHNANNSIRSSKDIREIITLYQDKKMEPKDIAKLFNCETKYIYEIIEGRIFKCIYDEYDIELRPRPKTPIKHTNECIELFLKGYSYSKIANYIGIDKSGVGKIIRRYIKENPDCDIETHPNKKFLDDKILHDICRILEQTKGKSTGYRYHQIISKLNFEDNESNYSVVKNIIYKKCYVYISKNYDI